MRERTLSGVDEEVVTPEENRGASARSRHVAVFVISTSLLRDVVDAAGGRQLLGGLGPGAQEGLVASAGEG